MSEEAVEFDEYDGKIPVIDKRRFNTDGEMVADAEPEKPAEPAAKDIDPFSVDAIEAEFARLLGRDPKAKS